MTSIGLSDGNVGIGTGVALNKLEVRSGYTTLYDQSQLPGYNSTGTTLYPSKIILGNAYSPVVRVSYPNNTYTDSTDLQFLTAGGNTQTETQPPRMVIQGQSGNVGIGTTNPQAMLHVNGTLQTNNPYYFARVRDYGGDRSGDIIFDRTPETNVLSWLNTTTGHFTPLVKGAYLINCSLTTQNAAYLVLYKNGIEITRGLAQIPSGTGWSQVVLNAIVSYNGTTDYTYFFVLPGGSIGATSSVGSVSFVKL